VLNAQNTYAQARLALVQAQANRLADTAALFQALGGWWHRPTDRTKTSIAANQSLRLTQSEGENHVIKQKPRT
jgi:hypothetical protein